MQSRPAGDPVATTVPDGNVPVLFDTAPAAETLPIQSQPVDDPLAMNIPDNSPPVFFDMAPFGDRALSPPAGNWDGIATVQEADLLPGSVNYDINCQYAIALALHATEPEPMDWRPEGPGGHTTLPQREFAS